MTSDAREFDRYCLGCRHSLRGLESRNCPECERAFDPDDPRSTCKYPYSTFMHVVARVGVVLVFGCAVYAVIVFGLSALGMLWEMGMLLLVIMTAPYWLLASLLVCILAAIPRVPWRKRTRAVAILLPLIVASIAYFNWPLRLNFLLHKPWFDVIADRVQSGEQIPGSRQVGVFYVRSIQTRELTANPPGNVGFQFTGGTGGGVFLVRRGPGAWRTWYNTNWEIDLGDEWFLVYED